MAEIKSTMEMVMERAARMAGSSTDTTYDSEEQRKEGMRLAAAYMRGELDDPTGRLATLPAERQPATRQGAVEGLLRNIFLAREEEQLQAAEKAMTALLAIGRGEGQLPQVFAEMQRILAGYSQHREQLRQQLEAQFSQQMELMEQNLARQTGMSMKLQPSQHPKFQEEWSRLQAQLDDQYGRALSQLKAMTEELLTGG
ncbi:MAG: DUF6657 family protein [Thermodesulfobacteriota bacterium]